MNDIHPTAIIEGDVKLGYGNKILPYSIIKGPVEIGNDNIIGPHVCIGQPGQDTRNKYYDSSNSIIKIGDRNIIREFCSIQKPCYEDITKIGNDVFLMQSVHIPHDCRISDNVVITPMCVLAGLTKILEGANLGMSCTISQYNVIGQYSIVATGAAAVKNVKPFSRYIPGKPISVNNYAIKKFGFDEYTVEISEYVLKNIYPKSEVVLAIINKFEELHINSKKELY
jgi:UDP-N-acetylglucosamine acyltransferase